MYKFILIGFSCLWLAACGGGGSSGGSTSSGAAGVTVATGIFKDSNTSGLHYKSGSQEGDTGADGSFSYEVGKPVIFSLGPITLGTIASGKSIVTPIDLVTNGASTDSAVQNLVRFLMMLDSDGVASNGIQISAGVKASAATWPAINFNLDEATFATAVNPIRTSINNLDFPFDHLLKSSATAQSHLEASLRCARSGGYKGAYTGQFGNQTDSGKFGFLVDAITGHVDGLGFSNSAQLSFDINGSNSVSYDQQASFISGLVSSGPVNGGSFEGRFTSINEVNGNWSLLGQTLGTFIGSRVGGVLNAKYRFTGKFKNNGSPLTVFGLYIFDIDANKVVSGLAYNIPTDTLEPLSGSVSPNGTTLSGTTSSGATFTATIDLAAGTVSAASFQSGSVNGTFTASGCQLN
jgi:hypothetical protein